MHWKDKETAQTKTEPAQAYPSEKKAQDDDLSSDERGDKLGQARDWGEDVSSEDSGDSGNDGDSDSNDDKVSLSIN